MTMGGLKVNVLLILLIMHVLVWNTIIQGEGKVCYWRGCVVLLH